MTDMTDVRRSHPRPAGSGVMPLGLASLFFLSAVFLGFWGGLWGAEVFRRIYPIALFMIPFSLAVVLLGLIPLRKMWTWERSIGFYGAPLAFCFFLVQHFVFGFGGLLVAVSDEGYFYENLQGVFPWAGGVIPLQLAHLVSLYVGLIGVWLGLHTSMRRLAARSLPSDPQNGSEKVPTNQNRLLRKICYFSLFLHAMGWVILPLTSLPDFLRYLLDATLYTLNSAFFFWGFWWSRARGDRWIFAMYVTIYGAMVMTMGHRTFFLFPLALFFLGLLVSRSVWRFNLRQLVAGGIVMVLFGGLTVRGEDVRLAFQRGWPRGTAELGARISVLVLGDSAVADRVRDANGTTMNPVFRVGARIFELSALDVVARTPRQIRYWGWSDEDRSLLLTGWLPAFLFRDLPSFFSEAGSVFFLREYGWILDPVSGGSALPATLLADAWRRFGWLGVVVFYLVWAVLLSRLTLLFTRRRFNSLWFIVSGGTVAVYAFAYSADIISIVTSLPRRILLTLGYAAVSSVIVRIWNDPLQMRSERRQGREDSQELKG